MLNKLFLTHYLLGLIVYWITLTTAKLNLPASNLPCDISLDKLTQFFLTGKQLHIRQRNQQIFWKKPKLKTRSYLTFIRDLS